MPPRVHEKRREILNAIRKVECLSDLLPANGDHRDQHKYELDLEVIVYGRTYHNKPVGRYLTLLTYHPGETIIKEGEWADNYYYIVVEGHAEVSKGPAGGETKVSELGPGEMFGARAMLTGGLRPVTVKSPANDSVQILKVHRPALRLLRKMPKFEEKFEQTYQRHGLEAALSNLMAKSGASPDQVKELAEVCSFNALAKNHILFEEGTENTAVFVIIEGFVRRSGKKERSKTEEDCLGKGYCFGFNEGASTYRYTAIALSRMEVLEINLQGVSDQNLKKLLVSVLKPMAAPSLENSIEGYKPYVREKILEAQESLISTGVVDANNLLVMDMDLCVRCGNCSMACHKVHGRSRLTRRGVHITRIEPAKRRSIQSLLAPSACMHCHDPECLLGCPTGAISRHEGGRIDIHPETCIGCGDCATQCPYDAIFMINCDEEEAKAPAKITERLWRSLAGFREPEAPPVDIAKDMLAVKCNLCYDRDTLNPKPSNRADVYSCEENCPTGALARIKPDDYFWEIARIKNLKMVDQTHAYGRNIHKADPPKRWIHAVGILVFVLVTAVTIRGLYYHGYGQLFWGFFKMRWVTGIAGFAGIAGASSYHWRRQVYDKRRRPLRYWTLVHYYLGVTAGVIVFLHGGTFSGGALTTLLMISFDVVIFTGLFGIVCYQIIPRVLTRIEGAPLLLEDLKVRRQELRDELSELTDKSPEHVKLLIRQNVSSRFMAFRAALHVLAQGSLGQLLKSTAQKSAHIAVQLKNEEERRIFNEAAQAAAFLPRVNALIFLHRLLGCWIPPHIASAYVMVALMAVHICQVVYALW